MKGSNLISVTITGIWTNITEEAKIVTNIDILLEHFTNLAMNIITVSKIEFRYTFENMRFPSKKCDVPNKPFINIDLTEYIYISI